MFYGLDQVFNILFAIIFFCVLGTMVYIFVKNISTWNKNNNSPRLTVTAKIVAKRTKVFHNQQSDGFSTTTSTSYYVTFEVKSGDRMELSVAGKEYGQMAEGDVGELSFQGTRFLRGRGAQSGKDEKHERKNKLWKLGTRENAVSDVWAGSSLSCNYCSSEGCVA